MSILNIVSTVWVAYLWTSLELKCITTIMILFLCRRLIVELLKCLVLLSAKSFDCFCRTSLQWMSIQQVDLRIRNSNYCGVREWITFVNDFTHENIIQVKPNTKHLFFLSELVYLKLQRVYKETICLHETKVMPWIE